MVAAEVDLVIRRGTVVDGTGSIPFIADVAVTGKKIVAVGPDLDLHGKEEQDASGMIVAPGWIDPHTHFDAQWSWDPYLSPSSSAGVTTCVMGNCGIGFAPCQADRRQFLRGLIEAVEDIPEKVMAEGLTYDFETFEEYMESIERKELACDVAVMVGHCAIRAWVMGKRASLPDRPGGPTDCPVGVSDIKDMAALVQDAVAAGAIGFSTSRLSIHRDPQGNLTPGALAGRDELIAIGDAVAAGGGGVFEFSTDFASYDDWKTVSNIKPKLLKEYRKDETRWMVDLSRAHGDKVAFSFGMAAAPDSRKFGEYVLREVHKAGGLARGQVFTRPQGFLLSLSGRAHHFVLSTTFRKLSRKESGAALSKTMQKKEVRAKILQEVKDLYQMRETLNVATQSFLGIMWPMSEVFEWRADYEPAQEDSMEHMARREGGHPLNLIYDKMTSGVLLWKPQAGMWGQGEAPREMMEHPETIPGFGDAGAHGTIFTDAVASTHSLTHWGRDRTQGPRIKIETLVKKQTSEVASLFGMNDRGTLAPGMRADVNIIDFNRLKVQEPFLVADLPLGQTRWLQEVEGYVLTLVGGCPTYRNGQPTGLLPGTLLRNPRRNPDAWKGISHQVSGPFDSSVAEILAPSSNDASLEGLSKGGASAVARILRNTVEAEDGGQERSRL